jgi:hypothetical protein
VLFFASAHLKGARKLKPVVLVGWREKDFVLLSPNPTSLITQGYDTFDAIAIA